MQLTNLKTNFLGKKFDYYSKKLTQHKMNFGEE